MKFYKITNEEENHNGMQYHYGLNTDILPFNPSGDCTRGGIYFSREDVLNFLSYGVWIREVTVPTGEDVYENPFLPKKWKAHAVWLGPRRAIASNVIFDLLDEGANIPRDSSAIEKLIEIFKKEGVDVLRIFKIKAPSDLESREWLKVAILNNENIILKYMLQNGTSINCFDDSDEIQYKINYYNHDAARILADNGADLSRIKIRSHKLRLELAVRSAIYKFKRLFK